MRTPPLADQFGKFRALTVIMIDDKARGGRWPQRVALLLIALFLLLWVGAKVHFYARFGDTTIDGYIQEHWPFWAGMGLVALVLFIVGRLAATRTRP